MEELSKESNQEGVSDNRSGISSQLLYMTQKYDTDDLMINSNITEISPRQAKAMFRVRSSMLNAKMFKKSNPKYAAYLFYINK